MVSTYTDSLRLEKQGTGDNDNTWGARLNTNVIDMLEEAIAGYISINVGGSSDVTLTTANGATDQARNMILHFTGVLTGNINVIVPTKEKLYVVRNATSGSFTLTVKTSAGTGIAVTQGHRAILYCDGTNVERVVVSDGLQHETAPKLGVDLNLNGKNLNDANGNEVIKHVATSSAVNEVTFTNAATGNAPKIVASGSDTDIDLTLQGKGAGKVKLGNANLKFPNSDGSANQFLKTDGSATLAFATLTGMFKSIQVFTGSGTWTKPTGLSRILVMVWGAGGGGGGTAGAAVAAGGGGGGFSLKVVEAGALGATEAVTVGSGGAGGNTSGGNGAAGTTSSFGSHCSATAGQGGEGSGAGGTLEGGAGGSGSGGNLNLTGSSGGDLGSSGGSDRSIGGTAPFIGVSGTMAGTSAGKAAPANTGGGGGGSGGGVSTGGAGGSGLVLVFQYFDIP